MNPDSLGGLMSLAKAHGATASLRTLDDDKSDTCLSVMVGERVEDGGMRVFSHALFIKSVGDSFVFGFSQSGQTRPLGQQEASTLLVKWISSPDDRVFGEYEAH